MTEHEQQLANDRIRAEISKMQAEVAQMQALILKATAETHQIKMSTFLAPFIAGAGAAAGIAAFIAAFAKLAL